MFVPIYARSAPRLGIIQVNGGESVESDDAVEFPEHFSDSHFISDIISGRKHVRGIQAHAKTFWLVNALDDVRNLFERVAETRTLPGCSLQSDSCFYVRQFREHQLDGSDNVVEARLLVRPETHHRMDDLQRPADLIG